MYKSICTAAVQVHCRQDWFSVLVLLLKLARLNLFLPVANRFGVTASRSRRLCRIVWIHRNGLLI